MDCPRDELRRVHDRFENEHAESVRHVARTTRRCCLGQLTSRKQMLTSSKRASEAATAKNGSLLCVMIVL